MGLIEDLKAFWKLGEVSGTRADSIGSNTLTDNNTVTSATGIIGNGAQFERDNSEHFSLADNDDMSMGAANFSFNLWLKPNNASEQSGLFGKYDNVSNGDEYFCYRRSDDTIWFVTFGGASRTNNESTGTVDEDVLTMLTITYTTSTKTSRIYFDAGTAEDFVHNEDPIDQDSVFYMGKNIDQQASGYYDGLMDEVGVWKKVLTAAEITELYNSGAGLAYPFTTFSPSILMIG